MSWDLLVEYKYFIAAGAAIVLFGGAPALAFAKKVFNKIAGMKLPSIKSVSLTGSGSEDYELLDQQAIKHLRDRAVMINDPELIKTIKVLDAKFFDIHTLPVTPKPSVTSNSTE